MSAPLRYGETLKRAGCVVHTAPMEIERSSRVEFLETADPADGEIGATEPIAGQNRDGMRCEAGLGFKDGAEEPHNDKPSH